MKCSVISIDLAKNIFQVCVLDEDKRVKTNKKVKRSDLIHELRQYDPTLVVMEACYSANPWGRRIEKLGHTVKFIPPFVVKPFLIGNKNDANDALAIAEASFRPRVRFISVKSVEQQDIQSLQRIQELMRKSRTATSNQLRGLLAEYGEVSEKGIDKLIKTVPEILEDGENELSFTARSFIQRLCEHIQSLTVQLEEVTQEINTLVSKRDDYARLLTIPGVGPKVAATLIACVNDIHGFKNGRQFASWIGLTPSQYASGETNRLGKITKRGNASLRRALILGARAVLNWCDKKDDSLNKWLQKLKDRMHNCKSVVALANKLARIIWVVLAKETTFDVNKACA